MSKDLFSDFINDLFDKDFFVTPKVYTYRWAGDYFTKNKDTGDFELTYNVPGYNKDNITVEVEGNKLYLAGKKSGNNISATLNFPKHLDKDTLAATVIDGIITITAKPKVVESSKKLIPIT